MELSLLALRLVVGLTFAGHGAQKLFGILGGPGIQRTASGFQQMGLRPGRLNAIAAGSTELVGGLLLALGLLSPLAAAGLIAVMTAAVLTVHLPNGYWNTEKGFEYNLVLIAVAFAIAGIGAGQWSLDGALGLDLAGAGWALAALGAGIIGGAAIVVGGRRHRERAHGGHGQPTAV
jgi:putative oxidoreductase